ncbi:hypothetical protein AA0243_1530 [Novacetimonas hansenii NRIC 0243]|nr:hypothetical protein AA0243_1530 [Novacetimonas hansenii NRIC 0243]
MQGQPHSRQPFQARCIRQTRRAPGLFTQAKAVQGRTAAGLKIRLIPHGVSHPVAWAQRQPVPMRQAGGAQGRKTRVGGRMKDVSS